jgi:queuosine precursor transporter
VLTPVIIVVEKKIDNYLGHDVAKKLKREAMGEDDGYESVPTAG